MRLAYRFKDAVRRVKKAMGVRTVLCERCAYNSPRYCRHRERPFATVCEDFRRK